MHDRRFVLVGQWLGRFFPALIAGQGAALLELAGAIAPFVERRPPDVGPQLLLGAERRNQSPGNFFDA